MSRADRKTGGPQASGISGGAANSDRVAEAPKREGEAPRPVPRRRLGRNGAHLGAGRFPAPGCAFDREELQKKFPNVKYFLRKSYKKI